jgi:hypothetical protein
MLEVGFALVRKPDEELKIADVFEWVSELLNRT